MCHWWLLEITWEQLHDCSFSVLLVEIVHSKVFWEKLVLDILFWGTRQLLTVSWILFSEKFISYDFCTSYCFVLSEQDLWRLHVKAQEAYACKQLLGIRHSHSSFLPLYECTRKNILTTEAQEWTRKWYSYSWCMRRTLQLRQCTQLKQCTTK